MMLNLCLVVAKVMIFVVYFLFLDEMVKFTIYWRFFWFNVIMMLWLFMMVGNEG